MFFDKWVWMSQSGGVSSLCGPTQSLLAAMKNRCREFFESNHKGDLKLFKQLDLLPALGRLGRGASPASILF